VGDDLVAQTLVWPFIVVMADKFSDSRSEMSFAKRHHAVQALGLDRFDKSFGEGVQVWTPP
jgi:hypothetical protein